MCSKLTVQTPERRRRRSGIFINFEQIFLVFLLLTLLIQLPTGKLGNNL